MTENNFIKKHGFPLNEVLDDYVKNATYVAGRPMNVVYLDRETKFCLIVDEFHLSDWPRQRGQLRFKNHQKIPGPIRQPFQRHQHQRLRSDD